MLQGKQTKAAVSLVLVFAVLLLVPTMQVRAASATDTLTLLPGGMPFGVRVQTRGVLVVGLSEVVCGEAVSRPAAEAGLSVGDTITEVDGGSVHTVEEVTARIADCGGRALVLTVLRAENEVEITLTPTRDTDGNYKAGILIRDGAAGIGTVSFIFPESGAFAGLGHGICDSTTGGLLPTARGIVSDVRIVGVHPGKSGYPGELQGVFDGGKCGTLIANTQSGVYGVFTKLPGTAAREAMSVLAADEICEGEAQILCTVGEKMCEYSVKLSEIHTETPTKNFVVEVTDPALLAITGGIVQGMSGSPIVQNGKLVGAVTHVRIHDPTHGYGITVENMLAGMPAILK